MTGFGTATRRDTALGEISVEVRSLNNRFLDFNVRLPRELSSLESTLRDLVKKRFRRGKVDMFVRYVPAPEAQPLSTINRHALQHYAQQVSDALGQVPGAADRLDLAALLSLPGVVTSSDSAAEDGPLVTLAYKAVEEALVKMEQARYCEGEAMQAALQDHLERLGQLRSEIERAKDELLAEYRTRLKDRMEVLGKTLDVALEPARIETEIMLYADKSDITEELVRLDAHLVSFAKMIENPDGEPAGKSMDFLVQELLRETNTIGNKARGVSVASSIIQMKSEIEKIREQVQNLE